MKSLDFRDLIESNSNTNLDANFSLHLAYSMKKILVTGGSGYIGSHTVVELLDAGHDVVILDNLSNSGVGVVQRIETISERSVKFIQGDIQDEALLDELFKEHSFDSVIHFAGLKSVAESVAEPERYYQNNVVGSETLFNCMQQNSCNELVFSSSATVYGEPESVPISEGAKLSATNPYGDSKLAVENVLKELNSSNPEWKISILRYFNPVAAHASGMIGEDPNGIPNNLLPYIAQVAVGKLDRLAVFGDDYPTPDGTGIRDYVHVVDLARAHIAALSCIEEGQSPKVYNIGTGQGYSVLEVVQAFEKAAQCKIPYVLEPRRPGDIASCYADASLAMKELGWSAAYGLAQMMEDHWRWQQLNPNGYQ